MFWTTFVFNKHNRIKTYDFTKVCYKISINTEGPLKYREYALLTTIQSRVKRIIFDKSLNRALEFRPILGHINSLPYKEMLNTPDNPRHVANRVLGVQNRYLSNHRTIEKINLPSPFETNCIEYSKSGFHNQHYCIADCVASETLKAFKKVNIMCPVTQTSQLLFLSTFDLKDNDTFLKLWTIQDFCETQCSRSECKEKEVVTTTESGHYDESYIFWDYQVSSQISFKITSSAALPFVEFFLSTSWVRATNCFTSLEV